MRTRSIIIQVFSFAVIVTAGVVWMKSRTTAVDLQARLSALTTARRRTSRTLEQERDRLRLALTEANRRREAAATATPPVPVLPPPTSAKAPPWSLGETRSSREWRNEGQSSPRRHRVATVLWAAAGGDLTTMMSLIAFDDASRNRAQVLFDTLPSTESPRHFRHPRALVAGLTIQAVPASTAQLSWFHQRDADHATVGVLLGTPAESSPTEVRILHAQDNNPPIAC